MQELSDLCWFAFLSGVAFSEEVTIKGTINDINQLVADDGSVYEIADTDKGDALIAETGQNVTVTGTVTENEGVMTIEVVDFEVNTITG